MCLCLSIKVCVYEYNYVYTNYYFFLPKKLNLLMEKFI